MYQKGAYVLNRLRETLGEASFWAAVRDYSRNYEGRSLTTVDFQEAIKRSTGKSLSEFFKTWIYLDESPIP